MYKENATWMDADRSQCIPSFACVQPYARVPYRIGRGARPPDSMWHSWVVRRAVGERGGTPISHDVFDLERRMYARISPRPASGPPFGGKLVGVGREKEKEPRNATSISPCRASEPITVRSHWFESSVTPPHAPSSLPRVVEPTDWRADVDRMLLLRLFGFYTARPHDYWRPLERCGVGSGEGVPSPFLSED